MNNLMLSERGQQMSIVPQNFQEVIQLAQLMAKSSFVPRQYRGNEANCAAVCLQALRWGMDPFSVAQKTYFINDGGVPGYEAQLIDAVINANAPIESRLDVQWSGAGNDMSCTVTGKFKGDPVPKSRTCRMSTITTRNSPSWKQDPQQQLAYYTKRAWARLYCPDIIMGVYSKEEVEDFRGPDNAKDITPTAPSAPRPQPEDFADEDARAAEIIAQHKAQLGEADDDEPEEEPAPQPAPTPRNTGKHIALVSPETGEVKEEFSANIDGANKFLTALAADINALWERPDAARAIYAAHEDAVERIASFCTGKKGDTYAHILGSIDSIKTAVESLPETASNPFG